MNFFPLKMALQILSRSQVLLEVWCGAERDGDLAQPLPEVEAALSVTDLPLCSVAASKKRCWKRSGSSKAGDGLGACSHTATCPPGVYHVFKTKKPLQTLFLRKTRDLKSISGLL